jgi:hypothetical protein
MNKPFDLTNVVFHNKGKFGVGSITDTIFVSAKTGTIRIAKPLFLLHSTEEFKYIRVGLLSQEHKLILTLQKEDPENVCYKIQEGIHPKIACPRFIKTFLPVGVNSISYPKEAIEFDKRSNSFVVDLTITPQLKSV